MVGRFTFFRVLSVPQTGMGVLVVTLLTRSMKHLSIVTKEPSLCHEADLSHKPSPFRLCKLKGQPQTTCACGCPEGMQVQSKSPH